MLSTLLQVDPSLTELGDTATKLSQTTAEVGVYNMITGVFMTIVLIFVAMQAITFYKLTSKLSLISECSLKTLDYFQNKMQKDINIDQARSEISEQLDKAADSMKFQILLMKEMNHITNTEVTGERIRRWINNTYNRRVNHFKKFEYNGHLLVELLSPNFCEDGYNVFHELLYLTEGEFSVGNINRQVNEFYTHIKSTYNARLDNL